jgi:hypothetical protein
VSHALTIVGLVVSMGATPHLLATYLEFLLCLVLLQQHWLQHLVHLLEWGGGASVLAAQNLCGMFVSRTQQRNIVQLALCVCVPV